MVGELHLYKVAKCVCMCLCPVLKMAPEALRRLIATSTTSSVIYLTFSFSCSLSSSHTSCSPGESGMFWPQDLCTGISQSLECPSSNRLASSLL